MARRRIGVETERVWQARHRRLGQHHLPPSCPRLHSTRDLRAFRSESAGQRSRATPSPTSPITGRSIRAPFGSPSTAPRCATPSGPTPSTSSITALDHARSTPDVGVVLLTGNGPSPKDGGWAFCSGGDQRIRGADGYQYSEDETAGGIDRAKLGRLHILECQRLIRFMPKIVIAVVPGWAVGGGHSLHVVCDLTIACTEHALFKQTDSDVASFDGGFGSAYLARMVGQKRAREIFFLGHNYSADEAQAMGMVNASVPHSELEAVSLEWAREIGAKSPTSQRMLKYAFNMIDDGLVGQQLFAGEATRLAYGTRGGSRRTRRLSREAGPGLPQVPVALLRRRLP